MGNGKTLVLTLFPASEQKIPIIYKKTKLFCTPECKQKNSILALNHNLKLNPNCNPGSNPNVNPNPNSKSKLQQTTNNNKLKNKKDLST